LRLWDAQVAALKPRYRCVRFTLPGFDAERGPWPMSLAQTVALIGRIADAVSPGRPLVLLLHDWGCAYGYQYALTHASRASRIIGVDVDDAGTRAHARSLTLADKAMIAAYQWWLAAAWRLGGASGDAMTRVLARLAGAPKTAASVGHSMDYPYYLLWTGAYADFQRRMRQFDSPCPMLYVFGRRKPLQFHSPSWAARLAARPGHRVVGMDTGHWPMLEQPVGFNKVEQSWLAQGDAASH
jgi:pimeloyl-ACP methyl ester carboxylesterase